MVGNGKHKMNLSMQMKQMEDGDMVATGGRHNLGNSRNNHSRMPSLPSNIKGSIGGMSGTGPNMMQIHTHQNLP